MVKLYDLKNKKHVECDLSVCKRKALSVNGGTRYQLIGQSEDGRPLFKFISATDFNGQFKDLPTA